MIRSGNPLLRANTFTSTATTHDGVMTVEGTVNKTGILLMFLMAGAFFVWDKFYSSLGVIERTPFGEISPEAATRLAEAAGQGAAALMPFIMGGFIGGLIFALITSFKKEWAPITAPIYALCEGLALGGISAILELQFQGIVIQAVGLTFGTLFALLAAYRSGMIKVTENFKLGVAAATGGILVVYLVNMVMSFFGSSIPFIHSSGTFGIAFSLFVVVIAALNLVMDFDFIEHGAEHGAPKFMEWFGAFALIVTLVWLYIEILHLLSKLRSNE